jgi:asparagine synthase (glutamine-hydrolysing)
MIEAMRHEPFYKELQWSDETQGIYAGIVGRSEPLAAEIPPVEATDAPLVFFYGEEFSIPRATGDTRRRATGNEVSLSKRFVEESSFPASLEGMFQGLVVDRREKRACLFNDRYGLQRLYVHETHDALYFAAEAKAILAVCPATRSLDLRGLGELITLGCVLENRSLFEGIHLLPPASWWTFRNGALESRNCYFHPREWEEQDPLSSEAYYQNLTEILDEAIPRYLAGPNDVALALTGGLDTRVILARGRPMPGSLPCYTFGGSLRESQDVKIARRVAAACGQKHEIISVGEEFLSEFRAYAERTVWLSDGTVGVANAVDLYVSERARRIAPRKVVGTWGSELLRQAVTFKPDLPDPRLYVPELTESCQLAARTYASLRDCHPISFAAFRQTPWAQYGVEALEQTQISVLAPFLHQAFVRAVYRSPKRGSADVRARLIAERSPELAAIPSDRGVRSDGKGPAALAGRLYQEFTFKAEFALDLGMPQWLARWQGVLAGSGVDSAFLGRHKFTHFRKWYRRELADDLKELLLDGRLQAEGLVQGQRVRQIVLQHMAGRANWTNAIHSLLTLECLYRKLAEV